VYPPGQNQLDVASGAKQMRAAAAAELPSDIRVEVTGHDPLLEDSLEGTSAGSGVLVEALIGGAGALLVLLFVFGTLPAVMIPLLVAVASVLNTFTLVWLLTYVTDVSIIVQFLIALVGLGVAIDYSLLMIFRFRDELRHGREVDDALAVTMTHAGHAVIVSGTTVAVGLLAMVLLPLPLLRSMGIGGMLIPVVSVLATLTLLPAMLAVLGPRINSLRVMPRRLIDTGQPEHGAWGRWARFVLRRPRIVAAVGMTLVVLFAGYGTQLHPAEAELRYFPGQGSAIDGRELLTDAGISHGVMKSLTVLVEDGGDAEQVAATLADVPGVAGATAPPGWQRGGTSLVEGFATTDGADPKIIDTIQRAKSALAGSDDVDRYGRDRPRLRGRLVRELSVRAGARAPADAGTADPCVPVDRDGDQGSRPQPALHERRVRHHRDRLPERPRLVAVGPGGGARDHGVHPRDDLRVPVRALDGLRGVHARAHA
jgi:RND superfamily putative drug exporter